MFRRKDEHIIDPIEQVEQVFYAATHTNTTTLVRPGRQPGARLEPGLRLEPNSTVGEAAAADRVHKARTVSEYTVY